MSDSWNIKKEYKFAHTDEIIKDGDGYLSPIPSTIVLESSLDKLRERIIKLVTDINIQIEKEYLIEKINELFGE